MTTGITPQDFRDLEARVARLESALTTPAQPPKPCDLAVLDISGVRIDPQSRRAYLRSDELTLTRQEFDVLYTLMEQAGTVVRYQDLLSRVWGYRDPWASKSMAMHISCLRRKLGDEATQPTFITTVRGVGYRFENTPHQLSKDPDAPAPQ